MARIVSSLAWLDGHLEGTLFKDKSAVARIIVDCLFFTAFWIVALLASRKGTIWSSQRAERIIWGVCILLLWYIITIIDLFLHESQLLVPYNYFLIDSVLTALKFMAETFLVWNTFHLVALQLYKHMKVHYAKGALLFGETLVVILMIMAIYSTGSMIGGQIVWLSIADSDLINSLIYPQARFEAAFFVIQWLIAFFGLMFAVLNFLYEYADENVTRMSCALVAASFFYWLLSMSEMAFSVKYHLKHKTPAKDTGLARDALFGLFLLFYLLCLAINVTPRTREENSTEADVGPHPQLLKTMQDESRRYVLQRLDAVARDNEVTPPSFRSLVVELQADREKAFSQRTRQSLGSLSDEERRQVGEFYDEFLLRLDRQYGHMRADNVPREF